ncbi:carboxypeptidase-like regulatory domain-containing protein [uncultured Winogradskyella sp.]|uniref:carboxypeptidase-like regulatory domain-containing protein n=1 Tax=uncultured Winogradskyella sp. TaxID=395353 RepID=UPI00261393E4|nr:carboxypeptidase-like regulatory domain-containing protein [uncultured Winogradskyella sp.]
MKHIITIVLFALTLTTYSQDIERVQINGRIAVTTQDKEGVAVYNTSSNKGTVTDKNGEFTIKVALNDLIQFSSLQFKDFDVKISEEIITSKKLTVILVEEVNKLDEVVILPFGLTGNLNADLENVRTYNVSLDDVYFGLDHLEDFEFSPDFKTKADNLAFNENNPRVEHMLNVVNLAEFVVRQVADIDKDYPVDHNANSIQQTPFKQALDKYSMNYIHVNFNIPLKEVDNFIAYVERKGVDKKLLQKDKELQFLERITQLSRSFLKMNVEKN